MTEYLARPWLARLKALKFKNPERGTDKTDKSPASDPSVSFVSAGLARIENFAPAPADWRRAYDERVQRRSLTPHYSLADAERLAWSEILSEWHLAHGARAPAWQCAGCGEPISGSGALELPDRTRVHFTDTDCLIRYGAKWRSGASRALLALGVKPPANDITGTQSEGR